MTIEEIKQMLTESKSDQVIAAVDQLATAGTDCGNAYRQLGNMRQALNSYLESMELDPDGPAAQAYRTIQEILNFYDHDLYNP